MDPNLIQPGAESQMPPQGMPTDPGGQPISEEQKQALMDMIDKVRGKFDTLNAARFASGSKTDVLRRNLLAQVFEKLQMAGVDLSSRESVSAFILKLQQENPELAAMFEESMNALIGSPDTSAFGGAPQAPGMTPQNNMNININPNETLPQDA